MRLTLQTSVKRARVEHRSGTSEWGSPRPFVAGLQRLFGAFDLDAACGSAQFAKAPLFYGPAQNGLIQPWFGHTYTNPPWAKGDKSAKQAAWLAKAITEQYELRRTSKCTLLLPCRPDTRWYFAYVLRATFVLHVHGRLTFERMINGQLKTWAAPFPCMVVHYLEPRREPIYGMINTKAEIIKPW